MDFVRIPSVSAPGFDSGQVRASAEFARDLLAAAGLHRARLLEIEGAHPYVTAEWLGAASAPTILLYAHHDVQPPGRIERWSSDPFHPVERDGRLYGRGTADDKAGVVIHAAAIAAWLQATGDLPCNVKVLIEGEEEIGSGHLSRFLATYGPDLRADVMVLADAGNWAVGHPALTYSLRGLTELTVRVRTTRAPQHSGMFGGVLPDPVFALSKMLGALVDSKGRIAVPGLRDDVRDLTSLERDRLARLEFDEPTYRSNAGLLDGVELIGDTAIPAYQRLWFEPAISILAMDSHPIQGSSNQVLSEASARISVRLAPGQEPERVQTLLADSLSATAPWGVHVEIAPGTDSSPAWICEPKGPAFDAAIAALSAAFGKPPVFMGVGGSIPFVAPFAAAFGGIPVLLTGPADPTSRIHSEDESLHLGDWYNHIHAEAILFEEIAQRLRPRK